MNNKSGTRYKVLFRKIDHAREEVMDYVGYDNSYSLIKYLDEVETLNTETCDTIVIHEHRTDGSVIETYAYDPKGLSGKVHAKPRVKLPAATSKPMLALPKPTDPPSVRWVAMGRYGAREAIAYE